MRFTLPIAAVFGLCAAAPAFAATLPFHATLDGKSEVPSVSGSAKGQAKATLDTDSKKFDYTVTYDGLSGPATAGHFHGPASKTENAKPVVSFNAPLTSPVKGSATLTDEQIAQLKDGKWYVNIHTSAHPNGEIRGQMMQGQ